MLPAPGVDALLRNWDRNAQRNTAGVTLLIVTPTGTKITRGHTFTKYQNTGFVKAGEFQLTLALSLSDPESAARPPTGTGSLTFTGIGRLSNGYYVGQFTFVITNAQGGIISGNGVATWQ